MYDFYITDEEYETALESGIYYDLVNTRVRGLGWRKKKAISQPVKKYKKKNYNMKEWARIAEQNGIKYSTFTSRVYAGMSMEEAATKPVKCKREWAEEMRERRRKNHETRQSKLA